MEKLRVKECAMCGKVFAVSGRGNRCYCGAGCRREKILQASREYYRAAVQRKAEEAYAGPPSGPALAELNQKARDAGMTYGKYMLSRQMMKDAPHPGRNPDGARE